MIKRNSNGRFKKGHSGNPNGRPSGGIAIEELVHGIDSDEMNHMQEFEVRERFRILNDAYSWFEVIHSQGAFPDFVLRNSEGGIIRAEAEVTSSTFQKHGHDIDGCDLIICWRHNWANCPLPVLCLSVEWINYLQMRRVRAWAF